MWGETLLHWLLKAVMFAVFLGLVHTMISTMFQYIETYMSIFTAGQLMNYFGITAAFSVFIKILLAGWGFKAILRYSSNI